MKQKARRIRVLLILMLVLVGCTSGKEATFQKISAAKAQEMMENEAVIIVDVRTREEYQEGHIEGAINIVNEEIKDIKPEPLEDMEATILVYCRSGNRSQQAADKLAKMGYTNVYDFGGINTWPDTLVK